MSGLLESLKSMYAHDATVLAGIENGSVRGIPLTRGQITIVDAEEYDWLSRWKWNAARDGHTYYAKRLYGPKGGQKVILMHRSILKLTKNNKEVSDHINRNGLDNRKSNLRIVSRSLNTINSKIRTSNTSGFRGVSWNKEHQKWVSGIRLNGKKIHLGYYKNILDAARSYDTHALLEWGRNAILNLPEEA